MTTTLRSVGLSARESLCTFAIGCGVRRQCSSVPSAHPDLNRWLTWQIGALGLDLSFVQHVFLMEPLMDKRYSSEDSADLNCLCMVDSGLLKDSDRYGFLDSDFHLIVTHTLQSGGSGRLASASHGREIQNHG